MNDDESRYITWFFEEHSREELRNWSSRLKIFRYVRQMGGLADDGDSIRCTFAYKDLEELKLFLDFVGYELIEHSKEPDKPEEAKSYTSKEHMVFPRIISGTKWWEQPGHCKVNQASAFIWCSEDRIDVATHVTDGPEWAVTEEHVVQAEQMEKLLLSSPLELIDPPIDNKRCLCPKYHPDFFV